MKTSASCINDSFYVSIKVDRLLLFTQGSVLGDLIERWNTEMNAGKKNNKKPNQESLIETENEKKAIFIIEMYQTYQGNSLIIALENEAEKQKSSTEQSTKLSQALYLGSIHNVESTSKIYQYPVDITELQLKSTQQLSSMIYHFQPNKRNDLKLVINFKANEKSSIKIGQFQIDLNIYVAMFAQQAITWVRDSKTIVKKIQQDKQISQLTEAVFQVFVERDRLSLQRIIRQNKKGINVVEFKEHIRRVMKQKEDLSRVQQDAQENVQIQEEELKMQSVSGKKTKRSLKQKYQQYLAKQIESNLYYSNPQSEIIRQQVKSLLNKRAQLEKQSKKSSNNSSNKRAHEKDNQKIDKHDKQGLNQNNDLKNLLGKDQQRNLIQKLKILGFLIVASFLLYFAMTPDRKTQVRPIVEEQQAVGYAQL